MQLLSGAAEEKKKSPKDYYLNLVRRVQESKYLLDEKIFAILKRDIPRTLPEISMFREESSPGRAALERLLCCYVLRNPETVGYCQGMHTIAGTLLSVMEEGGER